ncbi:hypothetical protein HNQ51_002990 [Inhella inkyongensis]|uniref:Uncharacterized protein n=1 Tax=Inhella inkyongensis TaxID=392593 RepID=A0A840S7L5_9BURK|nr:hypothetical protein [Inhella inkyongensis]MBB5205663.1 hypothetical protein [Inhella inkyongensis]
MTAEDSAKPPDHAVLLEDGTVLMAQTVLPVWGRQLDVIHDQLNQGIGELTAAFAALSDLQDRLAAVPLDDAEQLRKTMQTLLPEMQEYGMQALAGLQIGDRLSQMLGVVRGDIQRLVDEMPLFGEAGRQRAEVWLDDLKSRYTTPEQHRVHDGSDGAADASGVDFF